jgi:hypothetical protein
MDIIEKYINNCLEIGITSHNKMREEAYKKMFLLDEEIKELDKKRMDLRVERNNFVKILKTLDPDVSRKKLKNKEISMENSQSDTWCNDISDSICSIIKDREASPREIIEYVGYSNDDPTPVYAAIKNLLEVGILIRNEDRTLTKGPSWKD